MVKHCSAFNSIPPAAGGHIVALMTRRGEAPYLNVHAMMLYMTIFLLLNNRADKAVLFKTAENS